MKALKSISAFAIIVVLSAASSPSHSEDFVCDGGSCAKKLLISEEAEFCAELVIPKDKDNKLITLWMSEMSVDIASRLNGESCATAAYFPVASRDANFSTAALRALHSGLRIDQSILDGREIDETTLRCLIESTDLFVGRADVSEGLDGATEVVLEIHGCERNGVGVSASMSTKNKVTMLGFFQPAGIRLRYEPRVSVLPSSTTDRR
jgi:hypothetical protein